MYTSKLLKNPVLIIGILFFIIFILDLRSRKGSLLQRENVTASSCRSALVKLDKRIPKSWSTSCEKNNLAVEIASSFDEKKNKIERIKNYMYRELANSFIFIAKNAFTDSLEKVMIVRLKLTSPKLELNAVTEGKYIVKFKTMEKQKFILQHLRSTVQVQEVSK